MLDAYLPTDVKLTCLHNEGTDQHEVEAVAGVVLPQLHIQGLHHAADGELGGGVGNPGIDHLYLNQTSESR